MWAVFHAEYHTLQSIGRGDGEEACFGGLGDGVAYEETGFYSGWESYSGPTSISGEDFSASYSATLAVDVPRYDLDLDGTAYFPFQLIVEKRIGTPLSATG